MMDNTLPATQLSDEQNRNILAVIAELVRDRLALAEHFRNQKNFAAIEGCHSEAFEKISKHLLYYMPELKPPPPQLPAPKKNPRKSGRAKPPTS
jgi:hypothetical protein